MFYCIHIHESISPQTTDVFLLLVMQTGSGRCTAEAAVTLALFTPVTGNKTKAFLISISHKPPQGQEGPHQHRAALPVTLNIIVVILSQINNRTFGSRCWRGPLGGRGSRSLVI